MSTEDLSESLAAQLTGSVGLEESGEGMSNDLADAVEEQAQYEAEKDIPVSNDVEDTQQGELDREAEAEQAQQRGRKVPIQALHEARRQKQELQVQLAAQQQQLAQIQAQWQAAQQAQQLAQQEAECPDFDESPREYIEFKERQIARQLLELKNGPAPVPVQQLEQQVMQEAQLLAPVISDAEARFEASNPDYRQAFDHVMATVEQNMRAQHPGIDGRQLGMLRTAALLTVAKQCQSNGQDVAAFVYSRAQAMGYQPASRAPRKQANTSLSNLAGSPRAPDERGAMSASQISDMSEKEFDSFWAEMKQSSIQRPKI
ncbi:hypothetical protein [Pseudomonas fluorescens]|uniref:Phage protein n=1 Tax=Pseudomonas fluorescens TaxID=294 RepID=A0A5E7EYB7_PSEFL|nr:hypothetical protein [Pseudomonas fluorescens]VVO32181.1 hypothetical protein PS691_05031 [Pseudomonas fluorescens]